MSTSARTLAAARLAVLALPLLVALGACGEEGAGEGAGDPTPSSDPCKEATRSTTWSAIQRVVFEGRKCTTCHGAAQKQGGLDLSPEAAYDTLLKGMSRRPLAKAMRLVFPGEQKLSFLYAKLAAKTLGTKLPQGGGQPMPSGDAPALTKHELEAIRLWIRAGAPRDRVVAGTDALLKCGIPKDFDPNKVTPPASPAVGTGVQIVSGPWPIAAKAEREVCFATYYDLSKDPKLVPAGAKIPCPERLGGKGASCVAVKERLHVQDPQSHHTINRIYAGKAKPTDPSWGAWTCRGGPHAGKPCDPLQVGISAAKGGADCGKYATCSTAAVARPACVGFGPSDLRRASQSFTGSQQPVTLRTYPKGVYAIIPIKGFVIWNLHGFNLSKKATSIDQYTNVIWAQAKEDRRYPVRGIFDARYIFAMRVPPFEKREYCAHYTLPRYARLFRLGSHVHKRGVLFRIWAPPHAGTCTPASGCKPDAGKPIYESTIYDDPVELYFDPPRAFDGPDAASRTLKYCAVFDNGFADRKTVKRFSKMPAHTIVGRCRKAETRCIGGPHHNKVCAGDDRVCDSAPGKQDGDCDACELRGGLTTEDEMLILLGGYYVSSP